MARIDTQFNLRVPTELKEQIEESAKKSNRSINAEAVSRLYESFMMDNRAAFEAVKALESLLLRNTQSMRRTVISERLQELLENIKELGGVGRNLQPARIAKEIGEDYAEPVENWFAGKQEPSFKQLEKIAHYLGSTIEWLQFGDNPKFPVKTSRVPELAAEGVSWLLDLDQAEQPTDIYFVRSQSETGELIIVKKYGAWRCMTHLTPYHVSERIGAGGESSLAHLLVIWRLLYKAYTKPSKTMVKSYLLAEDQFSLLGRGEVHPLKALRYATEALWWEDIWDSQMYPKGSYWQGWLQLCERMNRVVEAKPHLSEQVQLIRSGRHPFLG